MGGSRATGDEQMDAGVVDAVDAAAPPAVAAAASTTTATEVAEAEAATKAAAVTTAENAENDTGAKDAKEAEQQEDDNDWHCTLCEQFDHEDDELLICDGPCLRSYHLGCLGLTETPEGDWFCEDCTTKSHECFCCHNRGDLSKEDHDEAVADAQSTLEGRQAVPFAGVVKCSLKTCGKFYHFGCLMKWKSFVLWRGENFVCPRHRCNVCFGTKKQGNSNSRARRAADFKCMMCPVSYHAECISPFAKFNEYVCLCSEHSDHPLPCPAGEHAMSRYVPPATAEQLAGMFARMLPTGHKWMEPDIRNARHPGHFRLPLKVLQSVRARLPPFVHVTRNVFACNVKRTPLDAERCLCSGHCDHQCLNRATRAECFGNPDKPSSNCGVGSECGNRSLQQRKVPKTEPVLTLDRGWGLKAAQDIEPDTLVIEYCGEIIDEDMRVARLNEYHAAGIKDFYIMEINSNEYIDAYKKGSNARFINHSCDPNCELQKWQVCGYTRIGVFATRHIPAGTELTYDYQFFSSEQRACLCGAAKCRGMLGKEAAKLAGTDVMAQRDVKLTPRSRKRAALMAKRREQREEQRTVLAATQRVRELSCTARTLPGDPSIEVREGPVSKPHDKRVAAAGTVFLRRSAKRGYDFLQRLSLARKRTRTARHASGTSLPAAALPQPQPTQQ